MSRDLWIIIVIILFALFLGGKKKRSGTDTGKKAVKRKTTSGHVSDPQTAARIDHPHYFDEDDHECSICGARFQGKGMMCPKCGAKFTGAKEDDGEFIEEMVIWDDEDDD